MGRYAIFNGLVYGGGTAVIPNPEGTPTDELHSIQIDEDIYEIVGGGGGGGNASLDATTLYDTPITSTGTYTLADDYNNYDFIGFKAGNGSTETDIRLYAVKDIQDSMNDNLVITNNVTNSWFNFTINENELTIPGKTVNTIYSVIGYKIKGGSSGASAIEKTQSEYNALPQDQKENGAIYMVQGEVGEEKDLTERMSDYTSSSGTVSAYNSKSANFLAWHALASEDSFDARVNGEYWAGIGDGAYLQFDFTKPVMILKIGFASYLASNFKIMYSTDGNEYIYAQNVTREAQSGYVCTKTDTTLDSPIRDCVSIRLVCDGAEYNVGALHFYGYDSVESINKIYYMGTEYANTNGGSGGSGSQELISYDTTITTTQYGWWTAEDKDGNTLDPDQYELIAVTPIVNNSPSWTGSWDGAFYINSVDGVTHRYDVTFVNINDGGYIRTSRTWDVKVIYRDKNAAGGGGGSTVVPNPQEEPTDTLNTVEIDGVVYNIEGGSEGGQGLNPANYSTEEEVIGVWTNNLPVYKKTWTFSSAITVGSNSWADTSISVNDTQIHTIVNCEAVGPNGQAWTCISATTDEATQTYVRVLNTRNTDVNVKHLTLYYIKDGDSPIVPPGTDGIYNFYGMFVDTNNEILPQTAISSTPYEYTATENCFVGYYLPYTWANDSTADVYIDNVKLIAQYGQGNTWGGSLVPLKKGQVIKFINGNYSSGGWFWVYGATYSINCPSGVGIETYSTTEEYKIGKWINGKTLYQKTLSTTLSGNQGSIDVSSLDIDDGWIVDGYYDIGVTKLGLNEYMTSSSYTYTHMNDNLTPPYIDCKNTISADSTIYVTIKYTKNTETITPAWTGIGTSLVDYSTSEKIVGTWIDGSSIYQKTFVLSSPVALTSGDWTVISEINIPNADASIYTEVFYSSPKTQLTAAGRFDNGVLSIFLPFKFRTDKVTVRYTKTTT